MSSRRSARTSRNANPLYWKDHKVCDNYNVKLDVKDTRLRAQTGVQLYSGMKDNILAMQQTIGSPINTALAPEYKADQIVNFPAAWAKTLTEIPQHRRRRRDLRRRDVQRLDYLVQGGPLKEGDTVGHIYFEGEYGANGLAGSKALAEAEGPEDHRGADQVHRPGHERPGHPVQGRGRQGDRR